MAQREQRARAAKKAIRRKYTDLTTAVTQGTIPGALYEQEIIDDETLEISSKSTLTDKEKGSKIMNDVRKAVQSNPDLFSGFCKALERESILKELSDELKEEYKRHLDEISEKKTYSDYVANTLQADAIASTTSSEKEELVKELETYQTALARPNASGAVIECIKECIEHYIETTLKAGSVKPEDLQEEMHSLCHRDLRALVPSSIHTWVLEQVEEINKKLSGTVATPEFPSQPAADPVVESELFSKDTLYHASMCCQVSSSCTPQNFKRFLNQQSTGHMLEEVSMSMPQDEENVGGFLIAKRKNTVYVAFQGNPTLSWWLRNHASFNDGLKKQMNRVPWLFFAEQLQDHNRIVITGFSFGGMLACCVAANIWEMSFISTEVLEKDVVCITFGQPLIAIPFVQSVMEKFPTFETTVHSVLDREDVVPHLFHYFRVGCMHYRTVSVKSYSPQFKSSSPRPQLKSSSPRPQLKSFSPQVLPKAGLTRRKFSKERPSSAPSRSRSGRSGMGFQEPFAFFLQNITVLQEHMYSSIPVSSQHSLAVKKRALIEVQSVLRELVRVPIANANASVVCGTCYTMSCEKGSGLTWKARVPNEELGLRADTIEKLEITLFKQHNMDGYRRSVFRSYLEKQPDKYSGPDQTQATKEIKEVSLLIPEVECVEFHELYPKGYTIDVEGNNLWFCHKVHIGNTSIIATAVQNITRRSIQFNFIPPNGEKFAVPDNGHIEITLHSRFTPPIRELRATVKQETYPFSLRQIQLAKHTPSDIIQLAFWSAIFEWHPRNARHYKPSQRFQEVTRFIEEAAKVVPLESIFYAVAYCDDDIALKCSEAIMAYFSNRRSIPPSDMMVEGSKRAAERMRTGISMPGENAGIAMQSSAMATSSDVEEDYFQSVHRSMSSRTTASKQNIPRCTSAPSTRHPADENDTPLCPHPDIAESLLELAQNITSTAEAAKKRGKLDVVCNLNIEQVYPSRGQTLYRIDRTLKSPVQVLKSARMTLESFVESRKAQSIKANNEELVELLKDIQKNELQICAALLGAFMEQQIRIPLLTKSLADTAETLSLKTAPVAVGVWALFSLSYTDLQKMLSQTQGNTLLVEIADYIGGIIHPEERESLYAGKLQFLLQGIKKTVSCSSQYISYSLEHQLCNNLKFKKSIPVKELIDTWDEIFKGDALSLVAKSHRPLIARWLKWAVLVHDLREALAKYTCVGVIGLVNSGKSQLVNTLFKVETPVGTTEQKKTVVPLMYNLDGSVDGLDVIDFPGVDDRDHSSPGLAKMLITLSQVVVFVVDYRKIHTDPAKKWLSELEAEDVPLKVCLTHADRLYAELMETDDNNPDPTEFKKQKINEELDQIKERIGYHQSRSATFYCFHQEADSSITTERLREVNIFGPLDVGDWLVSTFKEKLRQKELADNLDKFVCDIRREYRVRTSSLGKRQ